jgi:hypothetical protein
LHDIRDQCRELLAQDVVRRFVVKKPGPIVIFGQAFEELEQCWNMPRILYA